MLSNLLALLFLLKITLFYSTRAVSTTFWHHTWSFMVPATKKRIWKRFNDFKKDDSI